MLSVYSKRQKKSPHLAKTATLYFNLKFMADNIQFFLYFCSAVNFLIIIIGNISSSNS